MKLRLHGHSIRIRLQQQELDLLHREGIVEAEIAVGAAPGQRFVYRLRKDPSANQLTASLADSTLTIGIAPDAVERLVNSDQVGIESAHEVSPGQSLNILVEKDFKCLTPRPGEEDAFPHPGQLAEPAC